MWGNSTAVNEKSNTQEQELFPQIQTKQQNTRRKIGEDREHHKIRTESR